MRALAAFNCGILRVRLLRGAVALPQRRTAGDERERHDRRDGTDDDLLALAVTTIRRGVLGRFTVAAVAAVHRHERRGGVGFGHGGMGFVHIVDHGARGAVLRDELCALHTGAVNRRHRRRLSLRGVGWREQLRWLIVVVCGGASAPHRQVESVAGRGLCGRLGLRRWLVRCRRLRLSALCRRRLGRLRRLRMLRLVVTAHRWEHQRRAVE